MVTPSDQDRAWLYSQFLSLSIRKVGSEWQQLVTDLMHARHGGAFIQVDPAGRGDKGCDGWIDQLMLACYGASSPEQAKVTAKIQDDFKKALDNWRDQMKRWAFVHNNANGLPTMAALGIMELKADHAHASIAIEQWPPQVLWDHCTEEVDRARLVRVLGSPPSDHPIGMGYLARCAESLARTRRQENLNRIPPVLFGKIEENKFGPEVDALLRRFQTQTDHVEYYFSKASPGEKAQVTETLHAKYDGFSAQLGDSDAIFHALCDDLITEAFQGSNLVDAEQQRGAAITVITHFFEICEIFKPVTEEGINDPSL